MTGTCLPLASSQKGAETCLQRCEPTHSPVQARMLCFTPMQPCTSDCSHLSEALPAQGRTLIKICKTCWWELALNTQEPALDRSRCRPAQFGTGSPPVRERRAARRALLKAGGSEVCDAASSGARNLAYSEGNCSKSTDQHFYLMSMLGMCDINY